MGLPPPRGTARHLCIAAAAAALTALALYWLARGTPIPRLDLKPASTSSGAPITIGPNIQVSSATPTTDHMGCILIAHPTNPLQLFAASTAGDTYDDVKGYRSTDGGATWTLSCTRPHAPDEQVADEDAAFGPDGSLFFVNMRTPRETAGRYRYGEAGVGNIDLARSPDGGATWEELTSIPRYIDRPCLAVDGSAGPTRGRMYIHANVERPVVLVSDNAGRSFSESSPLSPHVRSTRPSNPLVLADGAVLITATVFVSGPDAHLELPLWRSSDGGRSFVQLTPNLAGRWRHPRIRSSSVFDVFYPRLAADPGSPRCAGRVYCVWRDGHSPDESYILFACSRDQGASWSTPVILSEQPAGPAADDDYAADIPAIAVNRDGVVAVTWYDRRGLPKHVVGLGGVIPPVPGYTARIRVSVDGGETWQPSVQLNTVPAHCDLLDARYWTGLAASADGRFHAAWIGDSTGTRQIWTAAVTVTRH